MQIRELELSHSERDEIDQLLDSLFAGNLVTTETCADDARILADKIPRSVRSCLNSFRLKESAVAVCIRNNPLSRALGPTPKLIPSVSEKTHVTTEEALLLLYSSLMGDPFTWSSIQNGNLINEIIPIAEHADEPMSSGSANTFGLHTEDAFHEYRGEYLALFCLRNPTETPTLLASITDVALTAADKVLLFEPRYFIGSNRAHSVDSTASGRAPVLVGSETEPYLRINTNRDPQLEHDSEAKAAYQHLVSRLEIASIRYVLRPGDCLLIDNYRVAHGRSAYSPSYDGYDRWLKRVYITSSLRKSRALRETASSRVIQLI